MNLYILMNSIPVLEPSEEKWRQWKQENQQACDIGRVYLCGTMIVTKFIGYDQAGAGYLFTTIIKDDNGRCEQYGAKSWADAERNHGWMCKKVENEQLVKARIEARQRSTNEHRTEHRR
jgi:hypothetical protein